MKRAMWMAAVVLLAIAVAAGGTFALFSASTNTTSNTYTAGTLCLASRRDNSDPVPGPMFYITPTQGATPTGVPGIRATGLWAPGDSVRRSLIIDNPGNCSSMNAWLKTVHAVLQSGDAALAEHLWVEVRTDHVHATPSGDDKIAEGWLSDFLNGQVPLLFPDSHKVEMMLGSTVFLHFSISMPLNTGNEMQGKSLVVQFEVNAEQMKNNP